MRKFFTLAFVMVCSIGFLQAQNWYVYDGSAVPTDLDGWSGSSNNPGPNMVEAVIDDPDIAGNKIFQYVQPDEFSANGSKASKYYRLKFEDANVVNKLTVVARLKGIPIDSLDNEIVTSLDVQIPFRESVELKIDDSIVDFGKTDVEIKADADFTEWHIYRFTMDETGNVSIYMDENTTPVLTGTTGVTSSNSYVRFGDGGSARVAGYTDWMVIDTTGAYAPGEGAAIPDDLSLAFGPVSEIGTVVPIGESIQSYIDAAAEGDVIILTDGGVWEENLEIVKSVTIKAANGSVVRPVVRGRCWFKGAKGAELKLNGIEFDGYDDERYFIRLDSDGDKDSVSYIELVDLVVHNFDRTIIRASDAGQFIDSVLIDNCHFYNMDGSDYRLFYFDKNDCPVKYFKAVNSTFSGFDRVFLQLNSSVIKTVIIDHCNIHGRSDKREDDLFDIDGDVGTTFTITNSIISDIKLGRIWDIKDNVVDNISNCSYFNIDSVDHMTDNTWSSETAFILQDPMFSNGPVGGLYLDAASPALTASTTGGPIGDPRWLVAPAEASLFDLNVDIGVLTPTFVSDTYDYTAQLPYGTTSVTVEGLTNFADATVAGAEAVDVTSGAGVATVVVTAADASSQTYTITFAVTPPATDATLSDLMLFTATDTFDLVPIFDAATNAYTLELPPGTDTVFVEADTEDGNATFTVTDTIDVTSLSGVATVVVLAEDGIETLTYTVTLTVSTVGVELDPVSEIRFHHNSIFNELKIFNSSDVEMIEIYNITGRLLNSMQVRNQESLNISTSDLPNGVYLVRMKLTENRIYTAKFVK